MAFAIPQVSRVEEKTKAKCKHCNNVIRPNDLVVNYISSSYGGHSNVAHVHLGCLILNAPKDCEFEAIMTAMSQARQQRPRGPSGD